MANLKILLDSHTFVWFTSGSPLLSKRAGEVIASSPDEVFFSAASAWELATKARLGKWPEAFVFVRLLDEILQKFRFTSLPVSFAHGLRAGSFPGLHKDPFDRMLAAQAELDRLTLVTADRAFGEFGTKTIWSRARLTNPLP